MFRSRLGVIGALVVTVNSRRCVSAAGSDEYADAEAKLAGDNEASESSFEVGTQEQPSRRGFGRMDSSADQRTGPSESGNDEWFGSNEVRQGYISAILAKEKELLDIKRLHELSVHRVREHHRIKLEDYESRAIYFESGHNRHVIEATGTQQATKKNVTSLAKQKDSLRKVKICLTIGVATAVYGFFLYKYKFNPDRYYTEMPRKIWGSETHEMSDPFHQ